MDSRAKVSLIVGIFVIAVIIICWKIYLGRLEKNDEERLNRARVMNECTQITIRARARRDASGMTSRASAMPQAGPEALGRQENDVWNISGRMNSQNLDSWPTHDHHVSIDSFVFPPDYQAKDPRLAPPPYTEVDLPTYEEAINNKNTQQQQPVPVHTISTTRQENA